MHANMPSARSQNEALRSSPSVAARELSVPVLKGLACAVSAALLTTGCSVSRGPSTPPSLRPPTTAVSSPSASSQPTAEQSPVHLDGSCVVASRAILEAAEGAGSVGGGVRYVMGRMIQLSSDWWFVGVKARFIDPQLSDMRDFDKAGRTTFATNAPSGGNHWIPLSPEAEWDGVTPDGETIPAWRQHRTEVLKCVQRG